MKLENKLDDILRAADMAPRAQATRDLLDKVKQPDAEVSREELVQAIAAYEGASDFGPHLTRLKLRLARMTTQPVSGWSLPLPKGGE